MSLISCNIYSIVFVNFKFCNICIKQFFLRNWIVESFSSILIVVAIILLRKITLNFTIFSASVGVGATNHTHISAVCFCTLVISSFCLLLKLSSTISLRNPWPVKFLNESIDLYREHVVFNYSVIVFAKKLYCHNVIQGENTRSNDTEYVYAISPKVFQMQLDCTRLLPFETIIAKYCNEICYLNS